MFAILGAGAMGRLWAASLPADGAAFIARPGQSPGTPLSYNFLALNGSERTVTVPWLAPSQIPSRLPELVLVTTKAGDTLTALEAIADSLPPSVPIALFQNGLGSQQQVAERWPERPILAASTTEGANRPSPDRVVHAGAGATWLGPMTAPAHTLLADCVTALANSGLTVHPEPDILSRLWQKLVINAGINPFTALLDCPNGDILQADLFLNHIDGLCEEIASLMEAAGQPRHAPATLRECIETVARNTARNTSSMRSDIQNGRATEIDYINGFLVRLGQSKGIATLVNQMLAERVQQQSLN